MQTIDELIPLTPDEIKMLEMKRFSSNTGCGIFAAVLFLAATVLAFGLFRGHEYVWMSVAAVVSLLFLAMTIYLFWTKQTEDKSVTLDLAEGKKRRIVAPIEGKEIIFVSPNGTIIVPPEPIEYIGFANDTTLLDLSESNYDNKIDIDDKSVFMGKNLKDIAPLQKKDFLNFEEVSDYIRNNNIWMKYRPKRSKYEPRYQGDYVNIIKVKEFIFTISDTEYSSKFKKGELVEFSFLPNSKRFISEEKINKEAKPY
jgi:hypothetical protein